MKEKDVPKTTNNPSRISWRTNKISTKIRSLQTTCLSSSDVQCSLELGVQHIEETVGETPQEEEKGDETDRVDRLPDCEGGGTGETLVCDTLAVLIAHCLDGGWSTLVEDIVHFWFGLF